MCSIVGDVEMEVNVLLDLIEGGSLDETIYQATSFR